MFRAYKFPPPLNSTFNWENQQGDNGIKIPTPVKLYIQWVRSTRGLGHINSHPRLTLHSIGKINQGIGAYKFPPPFNFTFNWGDQQGYQGIQIPTPVYLYIQLGRSTRGLGHINFHPRLPLHSIGKINKGIREYKFPPPFNFTFKWEDQQGDQGI